MDGCGCIVCVCVCVHQKDTDSPNQPWRLSTWLTPIWPDPNATTPGPHVMALWCALRGDAWVKETVALAVPPLEREAGPACRQDSSVDAFNVDRTEAYTRAITRWVGGWGCRKSACVCCRRVPPSLPPSLPSSRCKRPAPPSNSIPHPLIVPPPQPPTGTCTATRSSRASASPSASWPWCRSTSQT